MKTKRIFPLLAGLAACLWLSAATSAMAQPPTGARGGPGRGGPPGPQDMIKRLDKNDDGELSKDEVPEPLWDRLSRLDANDDGVISKDEFSAMAGGRAGMGRRGGRGPDAKEESDDSDDEESEARRRTPRGGTSPYTSSSSSVSSTSAGVTPEGAPRGGASGSQPRRAFCPSNFDGRALAPRGVTRRARDAR